MCSLLRKYLSDLAHSLTASDIRSWYVLFAALIWTKTKLSNQNLAVV